jgi:hypothetical protein
MAVRTVALAAYQANQVHLHGIVRKQADIARLLRHAGGGAFAARRAIAAALARSAMVSGRMPRLPLERPRFAASRFGLLPLQHPAMERHGRYAPTSRPMRR